MTYLHKLWHDYAERTMKCMAVKKFQFQKFKTADHQHAMDPICFIIRYRDF